MIDDLLARKQEAYGDAWKAASSVLHDKVVLRAFVRFVVNCPEYVYTWLVIMSKMMRILTTPKDPEHWQDIAGYAQLVLNDLTTKSTPTPTTPKES